MNDFKWLFVSEIKGIQDYILATDKLKHIVGASELIASITDIEFYKTVLRELDCVIDKDYKVMMAAAGRLMLLFKDESKLKDLMAIWAIVINEYAPGVELVYDYYDADPNNLQKSRKQALEKMPSKRQQPSCSLPVPSLPVERCRRDGLAAVSIKDDEHISNEIKRKLYVEEKKHDLTKKFIPKQDKEDKIDVDFNILKDSNKWPKDFENITGFNDKSYMAVVHIDVNSMGKFFITLGEQLENIDAKTTLEIYNLVSTYLLEAAEEAAKEAVKTIITIEKNKELREAIKGNKKGDIFPLRPLVLAGDDLTFVIKSPYAIKFSESYMFHFNKKANQKLYKLLQTYKLNIDNSIYNFKLSAGITFTKSKFPFRSAYELCEKLCKTGKELSERTVSTISFYRQTTSASDDLDNLIDREFKHDKLELTYKTYSLEKNSKNLPLINNLTEIVASLNSLPRGSIREIASKLFSDKNTVDAAWNRFKTICKERDNNQYNKLEKALSNITKNTENPLWEEKGDISRTPLVDAINLHSVTSDFYNNESDGGDE